jgi:Ca-activated chloride channel family protein
LLLIPAIGLGRITLSLFQRLGRGVITLTVSAGAGARWLLLLVLGGFARLLLWTFHGASKGINRLDETITTVLDRLKGPASRLIEWILSRVLVFGRGLKRILVYVWQLLIRLSRLVLGLVRRLLRGLTAAGRIMLSFLMTIVELILIPIIGLWRALELTLKTVGRALQRLGAYLFQMILWLGQPFVRLGRQVQRGYQFLGNEIRQLIGEKNTKRLSTLLSGLSFVALFVGGSRLYSNFTTVHVEIWTNDTKASWVHAVTETFNEKGLKTHSGKTIIVNVEQRDSGDFPVEIEARLEEQKKGPTIISPGTIAWVSAADIIWQKSKGHPLVPEVCPTLAYAPIGFGMWRSMAQAMGYPDVPIGWQDIVDLAADPEGWARYGHPEWGQFKFGHTDPNSSNTGLTAMTSFVYATLDQTGGLNPDLVRSPQVAAAFAKLELITYHYGSSTRSLNVSTATRGKAYLHAVASSENSILATNYFQHDILDEPLVFIFPKEGAFWSENPFCIVDAPWVTTDQREAAGLYRDYLLSREAQIETVKGWLRPVNLAYLPQTLPDEWQYTNPSITIEDIPPLETDSSGETTAAVQEVFNRAKKKATTILVLDTSASMRGEKIRVAKEGLVSFLRQLDEEDEVMLYRFDDSVEVVQPLARAGAVVDSLSHEIEAIRLPILAQTALHDAVCQAKAAAEAAKLEDEAGEERRLYGIVLLSDGEDTRSKTLESEMFADCLPQSESADVVKVFTIAYGEDAVVELLERIAERTNGRAFVADPDNIEEVYEAISFEQ